MNHFFDDFLKGRVYFSSIFQVRLNNLRTRIDEFWPTHIQAEMCALCINWQLYECWRKFAYAINRDVSTQVQVPGFQALVMWLQVLSYKYK
jgi:hypothetical protein